MIDFQNIKKIIIPEGEVSIIARGSEILWKKQKYKQILEYLESTGTQYIDTGVKLTSDYSVELDYQITSIPNVNERRGLFGALDSNGAVRYGSLVSPTTRKLEYGYGKGNTYYQTAIPTTDRCLLKHEKNNLYVDNALIYTFPTATFTLQSSAYLGSFNYTNYTPMLAKYYSAKFWDGDTLVRDFIPVLDMNDVPCMYDKVTDTFFYNKGTGQFNFGYKFEDEYQVLDYIEMNGKQYIDTGYKGHTTKTRYETKIVPSDVTTTQALFGSRNTVNISNGDNCLVFIIGGNLRLDWVNGDGRVPMNVAATVNTPYEINITRGKATVNGTQYTHTNSTQVAQSHNFLIGNITNGSSATYSNGFMGKLYYSKLYENDILVRDLVPCLRKTDGKVGMYDHITKTFFINQEIDQSTYSLRDEYQTSEYIETDDTINNYTEIDEPVIE